MQCGVNQTTPSDEQNNLENETRNGLNELKLAVQNNNGFDGKAQKEYNKQGPILSVNELLNTQTRATTESSDQPESDKIGQRRVVSSSVDTTTSPERSPAVSIPSTCDTESTEGPICDEENSSEVGPPGNEEELNGVEEQEEWVEYGDTHEAKDMTDTVTSEEKGKESINNVETERRVEAEIDHMEDEQTTAPVSSTKGSDISVQTLFGLIAVCVVVVLGSFAIQRLMTHALEKAFVESRRTKEEEKFLKPSQCQGGGHPDCTSRDFSDESEEDNEQPPQRRNPRPSASAAPLGNGMAFLQAQPVQAGPLPKKELVQVEYHFAALATDIKIAKVKEKDLWQTDTCVRFYAQYGPIDIGFADIILEGSSSLPGIRPDIRLYKELPENVSTAFLTPSKYPDYYRRAVRC